MTNNPPVYPDYCHSLSPTIGKWVPLRAIDVHGLRSVGMFSDGKEIYHILNHPIKWVRLTGVIVAVDEFTTRRIYTIDDSSGVCVECVCPAPPSTIQLNPAPQDRANQFTVIVTKHGERERGKGRRNGKEKEGPKVPSVQDPSIPWEGLDIGTVIKIKGKPSTWRDMKQVEIIKIEIIRSTDMEVRCWDEVLKFRKEVLSFPWVVSAEEEKRCREVALGERVKSKTSDKGRGRGTEKHGKGEKGRGKETEEARRKRKGKQGKERENVFGVEKKRRREEIAGEGLGQLDKANHPSLAMRKRLIVSGTSGKFDALGLGIVE